MHKGRQYRVAPPRFVHGDFPWYASPPATLRWHALEFTYAGNRLAAPAEIRSVDWNWNNLTGVGTWRGDFTVGLLEYGWTLLQFCPRPDGLPGLLYELTIFDDFANYGVWRHNAPNSNGDMWTYLIPDPFLWVGWTIQAVVPPFDFSGVFAVPAAVRWHDE